MAFTIKKVRPLFTGVITTARRYVGEQSAKKGGLIIDTRKMDGWRYSPRHQGRRRGED